MACGSNSGQIVPGTPAATLTVGFGRSGGSPVPALQPYYCGGWATDTTPPYSSNGVVNVYGKFTQTDQNDNPVGVGGATATATILWPDGSSQSITTTTTSDGLATFTIPMQASAVNRIVLIQIKFVKGNVTCSIPQAAFFTAIIGSPTPTSTATPVVSPTPTITPTPCHHRKCGTPTGN